jgi:meromycolic acid enoyl-[acyl-carrier protein] reductase
MILTGRRLLITGVLRKDSIAFAVAEQAQRAGAEVLLTSFGRALRMTRRAATQLSQEAEVLELDVTEPEHFERVVRDLEGRWGGLDGALHSIAFAPPDALGGNFLNTGEASAIEAFRISAYSLNSLARALLPLFERSGGGSLVGLDFDASTSWPAYDWMGVSKAALESVSRYLARYAGPRGVRVNLVSAGPLATPAAQGIPGFSAMARGWADQSPLGWDAWDPTPVARAACFLLSDWSTAITGEILHVDGGRHAMGGPVFNGRDETSEAAASAAA